MDVLDSFNKMTEMNQNGMQIEQLCRIANALERIEVILRQFGGAKIQSVASAGQALLGEKSAESSADLHVE